MYVGGLDVASNLQTLEKHGLTYILNSAKECPDSFTANPNFSYLRLDLLDCAAQTIDCAVFEQAFAFIDEARAKGRKVLVHCKAGQSRSATIVISYLIRTNHWTLQQAYKYVQDRRPAVSPNLGFIAQLINFEQAVLGHSTSIQQLIHTASASADSSSSSASSSSQPLPLSPFERNVPSLASLVSIGCK